MLIYKRHTLSTNAQQSNKLLMIEKTDQTVTLNKVNDDFLFW